MNLSQRTCVPARRLLHVTTIEPTLRAFLLSYSWHFRGLGWHVDALTGHTPTPDQEVRKAFDAVYTVTWTQRLWRAGVSLPACCREIQRLVRENQYDIVHVHTPIASFITRLALRKMRLEGRVSIVYTAHGFHFHPHSRGLWNFFFLMLEKIAGHWTDALCVINQEDYEVARVQRIVEEKKLWHMPGIGIDLTYWNRDHVGERDVDALRRCLKIEAQAPVFLCVGDLTARKRHCDLLRGFAAVVKAQEVNTTEARAVLVLAGDGPLRGKLEAEAKLLGIDRQVRFVGFQEDVRPFYRLAEVTLLVSLQEGLPRSLMESLAMETPVITTDVRGNHELADETCGLLVPPMDGEALANAIRKMLGMTADMRREMGRQGRAKMSAFSQERCLELTERVYARLACQPL